MDLSFLKQGTLFGADRMLDGFLRKEDICFTIKNEIAPLINIHDFEDMYKEGGRPPISPKILLLILIMQFIERLSDRAASYNLRYRLDWKIAFGVELDFEGVHPTTLVKFRDRLISNEKASYGFDKVIEYLVTKGLLKKGSKQRIDSTHIIGKVRELSRLELFHETLKQFCIDMDEYAEEMPKVIRTIFEYYSDEISVRGISDAQKKKYLNEAGRAMKAFIAWVEYQESCLKTLKSFKTLKTIYQQNFQDDNPDPPHPKLIKIATGKDHVCSPHDTEARYGNKGSKGWLGYKAQVSETVPEENNEINFITHIDLNDATDHDSASISRYISEQKSQSIEPSEVYGDSHYNTEENIKNLAEEKIDLKGPVPKVSAKYKNKNIGFKIDRDRSTVTCPEGMESEKFSILKDGRIAARFSCEDCAICHRKKICKPNPRGKQIESRPPNQILDRRRRLMETEEFKIDMHKRNGIEGTISGMVRGQDLRKSRYRGSARNRLQLKLIGAAVNIKRLHQKVTLEALKNEIKAA